jgi:DNA-binding PadR family transcriptional regulator
MITKLVILGILNRRRHYGYEIKKTIEFEMNDFDIKFGSIYHALKSFMQQGLIQRVQTEQTSDGRPDRFIYEIQQKGRNEFQRLLLESLKDRRYNSNSFEAAMHFVDSESLEKVIPILFERIQWLEAKKKALDIEKKRRPQAAIDRTKVSDLKDLNPLESKNLEKAQKLIPIIVNSIMEHKIAQAMSELAWIKNILALFQELCAH